MFDYYLNEFDDELNVGELKFAIAAGYDELILKASMVLDLWSKLPAALTIDQMT